MPSTKNGIHTAFVKAQAEMTMPKKKAENPFFKSKYSDLTECWKACKGALANNEIGVMQGVHGDRLRTTLVHSSGETLADEGIPLGSWENTKNPAQELQKNITYARRSGLCSMLGMAPEDDDGNSLTQDNAPPAVGLGNAQLSELSALANDVGADLGKFCQYLGVGSLSEINPKNFDAAKDALEKKRKAA